MRPAIGYAVTGNGPAVLLLHGLGGDRQQALGLLPDDIHATRIAPDMPGHGHTNLVAGEPVTFAAFAALAADLLDTLRQQQRRPAGAMPAVGVSMGAGIAATLAAIRPDLVERLVLIRAAYRNLTMDTLVVAAPHDPVHPDKLARVLHRWIPGARLVIVPRKMPDAAEHQLAVQRVAATALASPSPSESR